MRKRRSVQGWSQSDLAARIAFSQPQVARVENGSRTPTPDFARMCDSAFGAPGTFTRLQETLQEMGYADWFLPYLEEENSAAGLDEYSNTVVMGLLQHETYARALFKAAAPKLDDEQLDERIDARRRRRGRLSQADDPFYWAILHETALRVPVGGRRVMRHQLTSLLADSDKPAVTIQVVPWSAGAPVCHLPFIVLTRKDGSRFIYSETYSGGYIDDRRGAVAEARHAFDRLRASALSEDGSRDLIRSVLEDFADEDANRRH